MKLSPFFLSLLGLLLFASCDRNALDPEPMIEAPLEAVHYDGPVNTAPVLQGGTYEAAVKFTPGTLAEYANKPLKEVYFSFSPNPPPLLSKSMRAPMPRVKHREIWFIRPQSVQKYHPAVGTDIS